MFNIFKKKQPQGTRAVFKLSGLHCSSCGLSIDNALEEVDGVTQSATSYAKAESIIYFDPKKTDLKSLKKAIQNAGYQVLDQNLD